MNVIAILQARTSSSRLPAKALLPIRGMPLAVLAARRAANTGIHVVVATSDSPGDDTLVDLLSEHDVSWYRGSLEDTLGRVVEALAGYPGETVVIRLTADNLFPDGSLLDELLEDFHSRSLDYLCCNGMSSGLPYGMSAEVMRLQSLREAALTTNDPYDREHVTPYVIRKFGDSHFHKYKDLGKGHFRCTVDTYDDYVTVQYVFRGVSDICSVGWRELVSRLSDAPFQPVVSLPATRLVVGGAQFGMSYGIANTLGQPTGPQVTSILKAAIVNGVKYVDTAADYGSSETAIGHALSRGWGQRVQVITKLSLPGDLSPESPAEQVAAHVDACVYRSCMRLQRSTLDVLLLHRCTYLHGWNAAAWKRVVQLRDAGYVRALGVSVQTPEELNTALAVDAVDLVQMPFNLLDWRWTAAKHAIEAARECRPLTVHARSALLQGLLANRDVSRWQRAHVVRPAAVYQWLDAQVDRCERSNAIDLCLAYVRAQEWIDGVVLGMESIEQLEANLEYFDSPSLGHTEVEQIDATRPCLGINSLNPAYWRGGEV